MNEQPTSRDQFAPVAEAYLTSAVHASGDALSRLVELVQPAGGSILDVGTGAGHVAYTFAPHVDEVVAFDMTPEMLAIVERESALKGLENVSVVEGNAEDMPFENGRFDGVACRVAAHHFLNVPVFVHEVFRVLKPGGWFLLVDTVAPEDDFSDEEVNAVEKIRDPSHHRNWKISEWQALTQEVGFRQKDIEVNRKRLEFLDWMDRMRVPAEHRAELTTRIMNSTGLVRDYFAPDDSGDGSFDLAEVSLLSIRNN